MKIGQIIWNPYKVYSVDSDKLTSLFIYPKAISHLSRTYIGYGKVSPIDAKIQGILGVPTLNNDKSLRWFLGMVGYCRKFCHNFSDVAAPLTQLLTKMFKFTWTSSCQKSFHQIKSLCSGPVLKAAEFSQLFYLAIDTSDHGIGSVLLQVNIRIGHPISFFSQKFNSYQKNYSTVKKEILALVLSLQHFDVYIIFIMPIHLCVY